MTTSDSEIRHFGRRKGKPLKKRRSRVIDELLPRLRVSAPDDGAPINPAALFGFTPEEIWFEIGFGNGEHLAAQAADHPDFGFIGCEPFLNGVAALLMEVEDRDLKNVRVADDDARPILDALPDACLDRLFILFPDPWPKTRHHKRRFIGPANLDRLARVLKPGAELRFASDHPGYVDWALFHLTGDPRFQWLAKGPDDWRTPPADWKPTRYQEKSLAGVCTYLRFRRTEKK